MLALLSLLVAGPALAQDWPQPGKTIQLIVPAPGGSGTGDTIARVLAEELQSRLKTTFVIDNKAGANGNIGATAAAATPGDGYHFLFSWAGTLESQRWIWYRSTKSVPRRFRLASISAKMAFLDRPMPLGPLRIRWLTLVAITTSPRRA